MSIEKKTGKHVAKIKTGSDVPFLDQHPVVIENQADILQLARDLYVAPSLDHDGLPQFEYPVELWLQTFFKGYSKIESIGVVGTSNPTNIVQIEAPAVVEINGRVCSIPSSITIDITNAGDREGALTNGTWYYIYVTADTVGATVFGAKFSATEPTLDITKRGYYHPSQAYWRCIGSSYYLNNNIDDGGGLPAIVAIRPFYKTGDTVRYYYFCKKPVAASGNVSLTAQLPRYVHSANLRVTSSSSTLVGSEEAPIAPAPLQLAFNLNNNFQWKDQRANEKSSMYLIIFKKSATRSIYMMTGSAIVGIASYVEPY